MKTDIWTFRTMDRPHEIHPQTDVQLHVRAGCQNDIEVGEEVIRGDGYHLDRMKSGGFNPRVIIDVGAHIGSFSCFAHALWPNARIIAVEPHPSSFEVLAKNCPAVVECHNFAVGGKRGATLFFEPELYGGASQWFDNANRESLKVQVQSFDELVRGVEHIDLLKLDCEGAEFSVLEDMTAATAGKIRAIIGEYHSPTWMTKHDNAFHLLRERIQAKMPWLTVVTDADRDPQSELGAKIGPFLAFNATKDRALFDIMRTCVPPQPKE